MIQQVFEALPVETPTLASSVQPLQQNLHCPTVELFQPDSIPFHSVVVVIPAELAVQLREEGRRPASWREHQSHSSKRKGLPSPFPSGRSGRTHLDEESAMRAHLT